GHRPDRGLEFVGDIGLEVTTDGVDAHRFGLVVADDKREGGAQGSDTTGEVAQHLSGVLPRLLEVRLLDEAAGPDTADAARHLGRGERMASDQAEGIGGWGGFDDIVAGVDDDRGRGQDREHLGDAFGQVVFGVQIGSITGAFAESERQNARYAQSQAYDAD